jgi:fumarate hydratase subunit beta
VTIAIDFRSGFPTADEQPLHAGDAVELTGPVFTLRDASAARVARSLERGERLPIALNGSVLYAVGPSPPRPGQIVGSAGPTTTARMARYLPILFAAGVRAVIGKGELDRDDMHAFVKHRGVYFAALGGTGALLARHVKGSETIAYPDLGAEALHRLDLEAFPAVVIIDHAGRNFHEEARAAWRRG